MTSRPAGNAADAFTHTKDCGTEFAGVNSIAGAAVTTANVGTAVGATVAAVGAAAPPHELRLRTHRKTRNRITADLRRVIVSLDTSPSLAVS